MKKKQVRKRKPSIYYKTEMVKLKGEIIWRCVEMPSKLVLQESFFEEKFRTYIYEIDKKPILNQELNAFLQQLNLRVETLH